MILQRRPRIKLHHAILGGPAIVGLLTAGLEVYDHVMAERAQRRGVNDRLELLEQDVCRLKGRRWWQGDCVTYEEWRRAMEDRR